MKEYQVEEAAGLIAARKSLLHQINNVESLRGKPLALCEQVNTVDFYGSYEKKWMPVCQKVEAGCVIDATKRKLQDDLIGVKLRLQELGVS